MSFGPVATLAFSLAPESTTMIFKYKVHGVGLTVGFPIMRPDLLLGMSRSMVTASGLCEIFVASKLSGWLYWQTFS